MSNLILRGMNVKKYALAMVIVVLLAAGYSQRSDAAECAVAPASTYFTPGFTCDIDDKTFSNFTILATTGADTGLIVTPITGPDFFGFDFFTPNLVSNTTVAADIRIGYTVTCIAVGVDCIDSAELTIVGAQTGTGSGTVGETICLNATTTVGCAAGDTRSLNVALSGPLSDEINPGDPDGFLVHQLSVLKDANAFGGTAGVASISGITNTVDQPVPEPATLALLGAGLFGLAAMRRRKISR